MKKSYLFKFFIFAVIAAFVTVTSCKDYDDDISRLDGDISAIKTDYEAKINALKTELNSAVDGKIKTVSDEVTALKTKVATLEANSATKADIDAAKAEILAKVVALEAFNTFKTKTEADIATLTSDLAKAATKEELNGVQAALTAELGAVNGQVEAMGLRVTTLETNYAALLAKHDTDVADLLSKIADAKADLGLRIDNAEALIAAAEGKIEALDSELKSLLDDQLEKINANKDAIDALRGDLQDIDDKLSGEISTLKDDLDGVKNDLGTLKSRVDDYDTTIAGLETRIDQLENTLGQKLLSVTLSVNEMITKISLDYQGDDWGNRDRYLNFSTAPARKTWTFGQGFDGAIAFTTGQRILYAEQTIEVKVSPATADISKIIDKIYLIRRDGNNQVNNFVKAVKAERSTALRAAPTVTGLWNITFQMPAEANVTGLAPLVADQNGSFLFAVAIENSVDGSETPAERFVVSDFGVEIAASTKTPVYNDQDAPYDNDLVFSVKKGSEAATAYRSHTTIKNRYLTSESGITAPADQKWSTGVWNTTETKNADPADDRRIQNFFGAEIGKTFNVKLDNPDDVFAYYIVLDREWAVESSPSELNAWNSYDIVGVDKVYKANEVANLQINSDPANGDIIGFRVVAVNYDGTLVDPDGKSFYVYVGDVASSGLNFTQTITAPVPTATSTVPSNILAFAPGVNLANVGSATFSLTIGHSVVLDINNLVGLDANDNPVTVWADVKKLQIVNVKPSDLQEGVTYTGTLTLNNNFNVPFSTTNVTLTKVLPTFDGTGIGYKTSIHHEVDGQLVIYAYPLPGTRAYNLANALNGIGTDGTGYLVVNNNNSIPTASRPTWSTTNTEGIVPLAEIGVPYLPAAAPGHGRIYDLRLAKDFGYVSYNGSANHLVYWTPSTPIKAEFRSYVQDLKEWQYKGTNQANTPALKYADDLATYDISNITALPPVGSRVDLTNNPALQDGRTFTVTDVKILTGAPAYDKVNEYFIPTLSGTNISFDAVITSPPSAPVATKLQVTLQDNFGHQYTFIIPKEFNMAIN